MLTSEKSVCILLWDRSGCRCGLLRTPWWGWWVHCYCAFSLCLPLAGSRVGSECLKQSTVWKTNWNHFICSWGTRLKHKKTVDWQDIVSSALTEAVGLYRLCIIFLVQCCGPQYKVVGDTYMSCIGLQWNLCTWLPLCLSRLCSLCKSLCIDPDVWSRILRGPWDRSPK